MRRILALGVAGIMTVGSSGCAARINNMMSSWMGHHYSELIMSWGPPQQVFEDGMGGRILIWTAARTWTTPGQSYTNVYGNATAYDGYIWGQAQSYTTYVPPQTYGYTAWRMFAIDKNGLIYNWSWRGL